MKLLIFLSIVGVALAQGVEPVVPRAISSQAELLSRRMNAVENQTAEIKMVLDGLPEVQTAITANQEGIKAVNKYLKNLYSYLQTQESGFEEAKKSVTKGFKDLSKHVEMIYAKMGKLKKAINGKMDDMSESEVEEYITGLIKKITGNPEKHVADIVNSVQTMLSPPTPSTGKPGSPVATTKDIPNHRRWRGRVHGRQHGRRGQHVMHMMNHRNSAAAIRQAANYQTMYRNMIPGLTQSILQQVLSSTQGATTGNVPSTAAVAPSQPTTLPAEPEPEPELMIDPPMEPDMMGGAMIHEHFDEEESDDLFG